MTFDSTCGSGSTNSNDYTLVSSMNVAAPATGMTFAQAWMACRESSKNGVLQRLPTEEEWRRAARWSFDKYGSGVVENYHSNCNFGTSVVNTGSFPQCVNDLGLSDMAGNVSEYVDNRMEPEDVLPYTNNTPRFGFPTSHTSTVAARTMHNGIDNISRRYNLMTIANGHALAEVLGSDIGTGSATSAYQPQYDAETEQWVDVTSTSPHTGVRCAVFFPGSIPPPAQLTLPQEPQYSAAVDIPADPTKITLPPNRFPGEARPEQVSVTVVSGSTQTTGAQGSITISWAPWQAWSCPSANNCGYVADNTLTYSLYRFMEPTLVDIRPTVAWALPNAPTSGLNPYAGSGGLPLDPLAIASNGTWLINALGSHPQVVALVTGMNSSACTGTAPWSCTVVDQSGSHSFSPNALYRYVLVVSSASTPPAIVIARRQRFRSPYFAGGPVGANPLNVNAISTAYQPPPSFRTEVGLRLAGVFPVDHSYQQTFDGTSATGDNPESMIYVPMDQSGLDRDTFVARFPASKNPNSNFTTQHGDVYGNVTSATAWDPTLGSCHDSRLRTGLQNCGSVNGTLQSAIAEVPGYVNNQNSPNATHGDYYNACGGSYLWGNNQPTNGYRYSMRMVTSSEWFSAADWGDTLKDGTIHVVNPAPAGVLVAANASVGSSISSIEDNKCGTFANYRANGQFQSATGVGMDWDPVTHNPITGGYSGANSGQRKCVSRYGGYDFVGTVSQFADAFYGTTGLDNGVDGMSMGANINTTYSGTNYISIGSVDLWRGFEWASGTASTVATNNNTMEDDLHFFNAYYTGGLSNGTPNPGTATWAPALGCGFIYSSETACGRYSMAFNPDMAQNGLTFLYGTRCAYGF